MKQIHLRGDTLPEIIHKVLKENEGSYYTIGFSVPENVVKITNAIKEIEKEIQTRQEKLKALGEEPESPESTETPQTKTE